MKQLFFSLLMLAMAAPSFAQNSARNNPPEDGVKQVVKTNPLALAFGNFNGTYERLLNDKSSFLVSANYQYRLFGVDVNALGVGAGWRYYLTNANKPVPAGFYIQPQASASFGNVSDANYTTVGIGAELGYQWVWSSGFALDLGIGPQYTFLSGEVDDIEFNSDGGFLPTATLAIGYAF